MMRLSFVVVGLVSSTFFLACSQESPASSNSSPSATSSASATIPAVFNTWVNVTPANASLDPNFGAGGNYGTSTIAVDPGVPSNVYASFNNQGIWKSTDYGQTWTGPINTGTNGAAMAGAGGMHIPKAGPSNPPRIYNTNIRDPGTGFWRSNDGGVSWTKYTVAPGGSRQDFYPPTSDPYDANHLIMAGHEMNLLVQSADGGQTWTSIPMASGMNQNGGTAALFFVNTGVTATTRNTWLYLAQGTGGTIGTWRTTNGGVLWTRVDNNEHPHGGSQIYQPDTSGVVFMSGIYSAEGWGVLKSSDYGAHWALVGNSGQQGGGLIGTPNHIYSQWGWAQGPGTVNPNFEVSASATGLGAWTQPATPAAMSQGAGQFTGTYNGTNHILLSANYLAGLWRYQESEGGTSPAAPVIASFSAAPATISLGQSSTLTWSTTGATSLSINNGLGTVTGTSKSVSPTAATTYTLTATNATGSTTAQISVAITAVQVSISPASVSVIQGATQTFAAAVTGSTNTAVTWSITEGASAGTISTAGLYTAPKTAGTFHVIATSVADATKSATATVTVPATAPAISVTISPTAANLLTGTSQAFTCTVTGSTDLACVWTVQEGAIGGSVGSSGVYTAPATAGTFHVVATSHASPSTSAAATVSVTLPATGSKIWVNVTPGNASLNPSFGVGGNYGTQTIAVDPALPSNVYASFNNQGIWKSTDYGQTWTGPINKGTNGAAMAGGGGIHIPKAGPSNPPRIYNANFTDPGTGFWRSDDGGVSWTKYTVAPGGSRQDFYPPTSDPYDANHLLMAGHEMNLLVQSADGGQTWTSIPLAAGMNESNGSAALFFIDTGVATSTRGTWLYQAEGNGGSVGTWRTTNGGVSWTRVDSNEHPHGNSQIYQPDTSGVVFMSGIYSAEGWGVLKSSDYGAHWALVGNSGQQGGGLIGTPNHVYSQWGWAQGAGPVNPNFEVSASATGLGAWTQPATPAAMGQGAGQFVGTYKGTNHIILGANYLSGIWRYQEAEGGTSPSKPAIASFSAAPSTVSVGQSSTLTWSTSGATSLSVNNGIGAVTGTSKTVSPTATTTYTLTATNATGSVTAQTTVAVSAVGVSISPASISVVQGATQTFTAAVTGATNTAVAWSIKEGSSGGAISSAGLYTAPKTAGTFHVVATSAADATKSATATVTVPAIAPVISVAISPTMASLLTGASQAFTCTVTGSTDLACIWTVQEGTSGGSVNASGVYTAPATAGTFHVVATSHASSAKSATAAVAVSTATTGLLPALQITGGVLVDPHGNRVMLRGVSSQGMAMVYGDKANPGTYVPMTQTQYVKRATQTDATKATWYSTAIRLVFERFPCVDPARLYDVENMPYAMPDTVAFSPWVANSTSAEGDVATFGGSRYRAMKRTWRADRGAAWNPGAYVVGDVLSGYGNGNDDHIYRAVSVSGAGPSSNWGGGPAGTNATTPVADAMGNMWLYIGEFGESGATEPFAGPTITDYSVGTVYVDHFIWWQYMSADYTPTQALANFTDWKSKVMDPAIQAAVSDGLYTVVTDFDFGPAQHPLRHARMLDFWTRMAKSQWANNPQVIFELWNESEDIGSYSGGPGSWVLQKPVIQETINAIRAAGANNIIVVPTPFFSAWIGEATASPLTGTNIAYAWHAYRSQWEAYSSNRDQATQGLASGQAIMMTEWGDDTTPTSASTTWATTTSVPPTLRQLLEPSEGSLHPAAGWFAWALTDSWTPDLFSDAALTEPTPFGGGVQQWLLDKKSDSQPHP